jgi:hypothetical protein
LVRSNEDMGKEQIIEFTPPTAEEIRNARPLATVLHHDALTHAMLIAATLCGYRDDRAVSEGLAHNRFGTFWTRLSDQEAQKTRLTRT